MAAAVQDGAVHRDPLTGTDDDAVANADLVDGDLDDAPVTLYACGVRPQLHQRRDRRRRPLRALASRYLPPRTKVISSAEDS